VGGMVGGSEHSKPVSMGNGLIIPVMDIEPEGECEMKSGLKMIAALAIALMMLPFSVNATSYVEPDLFGAIAADMDDFAQTSQFSAGISWDFENNRGAVNAAVNQCRRDGGFRCKVLMTFNDCGAFALADNGAWGASSIGVTRRQVENEAINKCYRQGGDNCVVEESACNNY